MTEKQPPKDDRDIETKMDDVQRRLWFVEQKLRSMGIRSG